MRRLSAWLRGHLTRQRASRALDIAILALTLGYAVFFLVVEVFVKADDPFREAADRIFTLSLVAALGAQFLISSDKRAWLRRNWLDLVVVALLVAPWIRFLRLYRLLPLPRAFKLLRLAAILWTGVRAQVRSYGRGNVHNIVATAAVIVLLAAVLVQFAEEGGQEANIKSFGDAIWWGITTVTTVGYGDKFPTTVPGRIVAAALMLLGIALFGILTASLSSVFLADSQEQDIKQLRTELRRLREEIGDLRRDLAAGVGAKTEPDTTNDGAVTMPK